MPTLPRSLGCRCQPAQALKTIIEKHEASDSNQRIVRAMHEQKGRFVRLAHMLRPHPFMHSGPRERGGWHGPGECDWHGWGRGGRRFDQDLDED